MTLKIILGDIIKANATFIVNASNTELTLGSGVSMAFRKECGGMNFQRKLTEIKEAHIIKNGAIQQGDVIISDSGNANNFTYALHVAVMNYSKPKTNPYPNYAHIKKAMQKIVKIVDELSLINNIKPTSIAIPLLGCGVGGLNKARVYAIIQHYFKRTLVSNLEVMVYFFQEDNLYNFLIKRK